MKNPRYLAITGGVGGAKLALGLTQLLKADEIAFIVNTGDDFQHLGMHVSPDIDTLVYTLSGQANTELGWGRKGETWQFMEAMEELGGDTWFRLGDKDLAMHVERTRLLGEGLTLSKATQTLASALGVKHRILPMSDSMVRTKVITTEGRMDFQHYFVREQCSPEVSGFEFEGVDSAGISPEILVWLNASDLAGVIICPSNPFVSVDPVLALPGFREHLKTCPAPVIAVSPIVGGDAIKGPTAKMMKELNIPNTAAWVAQHYADFLDGFVLDEVDRGLESKIREMDLDVCVTNTVMRTLDNRVDLAKGCLKFIESIS